MPALLPGTVTIQQTTQTGECRERVLPRLAPACVMSGGGQGPRVRTTLSSEILLTVLHQGFCHLVLVPEACTSVRVSPECLHLPFYSSLPAAISVPSLSPPSSKREKQRMQGEVAPPQIWGTRWNSLTSPVQFLGVMGQLPPCRTSCFSPCPLPLEMFDTRFGGARFSRYFNPFIRCCGEETQCSGLTL